MRKFLKRVGFTLLGVGVLYLLLLIPDSQKVTILEASETPFEWRQDELWKRLEGEFQAAQRLPADSLERIISSQFMRAEAHLAQLADTVLLPGDTIFQNIENAFFSLAPLVAVQQQRDPFIDYYNQVRKAVKGQSRRWDMNTEPARNQVYRLLYGMRAAVEEILLAAPALTFEPAMQVEAVASAVPSTEILGIQVHSGDLLASRGGAGASALISRGNDYPGNFSHIALIYIDPETGSPYLVEAHIEKGVALATVEQYIADQKLRFMVLRLRPDLPQMQADPQLPQKAAKFAYDESVSRHIPYDFKMDFFDPEAMFCSEVGSYAYKQQGVELWNGVSTISSQGVVNWLADFGVEHFVTQMPSDLEYDPQLSVVAEWRDPETLFKDHVDNAVVDVMLEGANVGDGIAYSPWQLPLARVIKGWSILKNLVGGVGMIPEGMSATRALKNNSFHAKYDAIKAKTLEYVDVFMEEQGYRPPYWQLVNLAGEAKGEVEAEFAH